MLMNATDIKDRINSPSNLINRLDSIRGSSSKSSGMNIFGVGEKESSAVIIPEIVGDINREEISQEVIDAVEDELKLGLVKSSARAVLGKTLDLLSERLPDVDKPKDLSRIATDMSRIIDTFTPKDENQGFKQQVIIYRPAVNHIGTYQEMHVNE